MILNSNQIKVKRFIRASVLSSFIVLLLTFSFLLKTRSTYAAGGTFSISPPTGNFKIGQTINASVILNSNGSQTNAGEGVINYTADTLKLNKLTKTNLFTFWQTEPIVSGNTIRFVGGRNNNYTKSGELFSMNFTVLKEGYGEIHFNSGRILAADGEGTQNYGGSTGSKWILTKPSVTETGKPPTAPKIISTTHPEENTWYNSSSAKFSWTNPVDTTQIAINIDKLSSTEPNNFQNPSGSLETPSQEGVFYIHLRAKNKFGTSQTAHYKFQTDLTPPEKINLTYPQSQETIKNPSRVGIHTEDKLSGINKYLVRIDHEEEKEIYLNQDNEYVLPKLPIGRHDLLFTVFDKAGNKTIAKSYIIIEKQPFPYYNLLGLIAILIALSSLFRRKSSENKASFKVKIQTILNTIRVKLIEILKKTITLLKNK